MQKVKSVLLKFIKNLPSSVYYFQKNGYKSLKLVSLLIFSISGLIISLSLVQINQDIRSQAKIRPILPTPTPPLPEPYFPPPQELIDKVDIKTVLSTKRKNTGSPDSSAIEHRVMNLVYKDAPYSGSLTPQVLSQLLEMDLERGSKFHGYQDSNSQIQVDVQIVNTVEIMGEAPTLPDSDFADYQLITTQNNFCQMINDLSIDEVWVWTDGIGTRFDEFAIAGPASSLIPNIYPVARPDCNRPFFIMALNYLHTSDYNFEEVTWKVPSASDALESMGHRIEKVIAHFLDNKNIGEVLPGDNWYEFDGKIGYDGVLENHNYCGNAHWAPNAKLLCQGYNHYLKGTDGSTQGSCIDPTSNIVMSDCRDWNPQHTGTTTQLDCTEWQFEDDQCYQDGYATWWMQNMPGNCNTLNKVNGLPMPNWWQLIYNIDPNAPKCDTITPTPTVSPTPFPPTPTPTPPSAECSATISNVTINSSSNKVSLYVKNNSLTNSIFTIKNSAQPPVLNYTFYPSTALLNKFNFLAPDNTSELIIWLSDSSHPPKSSPASVYAYNPNGPPGSYQIQPNENAHFILRHDTAPTSLGQITMRFYPESDPSTICETTYTAPTPTPTPSIISNSASGLSCYQVCANANLTCFDIGTNTSGQNDKYWSKTTGTCTEILQSSDNCSTTMPSSGGLCSGKQANWTNCRCMNSCRAYMSAPTIVNNKFVSSITNLSSFPVEIKDIYQSFPSSLTANSVSLSGSTIWSGTDLSPLYLMQSDLTGNKTINGNSSKTITVNYNTTAPQYGYSMNISLFNSANNSGCVVSIAK